MADKWWKQVERRVADLFGTTRTPLSGGNGKQTRSDTLHPDLFVETKARATHAVVSLWRQTKELARKERKTPVVVLVEKNKPGMWLLVHSDDFSAVAQNFRSAHGSSSKSWDSSSPL